VNIVCLYACVASCRASRNSVISVLYKFECSEDSTKKTLDCETSLYGAMLTDKKIVNGTKRLLKVNIIVNDNGLRGCVSC